MLTLPVFEAETFVSCDLLLLSHVARDECTILLDEPVRHHVDFIIAHGAQLVPPQVFITHALRMQLLQGKPVGFQK